MQMKRGLTSIIAGLLTPFAVGLIFAGLLGGKLLILPRPLALAILLASYVFMLAVSLFKPISPLVYGLSIIAAFVLVSAVLYLIFSSSNLIGLAVIVLAAYGFLMGLTVALFGSILRALLLPRWVPLGLLIAVAAFSLGVNVWLLWTQHKHSRRIVALVEEIRRAEVAYAATQPDHSFTCNGPDLPGLKNIEWKANEQVGLQEKNQTYIEDHWLDLNCEASAHPQWLYISSGSWWGHNLSVRVTR